jgi:uracil-DNA glycosylase family 4
MSERKHPDALCEECPLEEDGNFCASVGPEKADLVFVGEAPGRKEARTGEPFVGESGQLLNMLLRNNGIERDDVFITNTVLCRPKDNSNPPAAAIKACGERLQREIQGRRPNTIVPLGNFASRKLLGTNEGITTLRVGPPKVSPNYPGVRIIPTFHPAATLYNHNAFPDLVTDFGKIKGGDVSATNSWIEPSFEIIDSESRSRWNRWIDSTRDEPIAIDIEVGVDKDISFVHPSKYRLLCVGLSASRDHAVVLDRSAVESEWARDQLRSILHSRRIICHNGKFDLQGLLDIGRGKLWFDTMLASYCLDERRGVHSLEYNAIEKLGSPSWKHEVGHWLGEDKDYSNIPEAILHRYNAFDVVNTFRLWEWFDNAEAFDNQARRLHSHLVEASNMLMYVEYNGLGVDEQYLDQLETEYGLSIDTLRGGLRDIVQDQTYNPNSWQQVQRVMKGIFNKPVPNTQADTLTEVMERALNSGNMALYEFLFMHLDFKKEAKSYGTYVKGTRKRLYKGRVHSSFLLHGTTVGRLASRNPNLQNVTRGPRLRRLFAAGSDTTILGQADYRQAELRVVCTLAREPYLKTILDDLDRNIFVEIGKEFYGEDFSKANKEGYIRTKAIVHGLNYGREPYSIAAEYKMPVGEAEKYVKEFFALIPNVVKWREDVWDNVRGGGDLTSPFGNRRRFWLITKNNRRDIQKEAYAFYPQNIVSNLLLKAGIRLANEGMRDMLRIPVHDAWVFECDKSISTDVARHVQTVMEETSREHFTDYVDFPIDIGFARTWGDIE